MHPEMLRYMLENSWAGDSLQRPWWSPKRACWQRQEETPFPAKEIVLGAKAKAKPHKRGSSQKASSERAKKEPKEEKEEYSYTYNYSTEEDEPEKGQKEVKLDCRSQQWHEEEDEEGDPVRVTTEDRWGSQGWLLAARAAAGSLHKAGRAAAGRLQTASNGNGTAGAGPSGKSGMPVRGGLIPIPPGGIGLGEASSSPSRTDTKTSS